MSLFFLAVISYVRLVFTETTLLEQVIPESDHRTLQQCQTCSIRKTHDMRHCEYCGTCSELYDHHCGVFNVCICAKNFKYFILTLLYLGATLLSIASANMYVISHCTNPSIRSFLDILLAFPMSFSATLGTMLCVISLCLLYAGLPQNSQKSKAFA